MAPSSTSPSARSAELQKQVNEVQSRLTDFIEATRPAHQANLRGISTDPFSNPLPLSADSNPAKAQNSTESKSRRTRRRRKSNRSAPAFPYERHSRKCQICRHPDRELIEADFVEWRHPNHIYDDYKIAYFPLYRHARATGLLQRRAENVSIVVQRLLEDVESVEVTSAFAILRGVHILASLNSRGQWTAPTTTHVVVRGDQKPAQSSSDTASPASESVGPEVVSVARHSTLVTRHRSSTQDQYSNRKPHEKLELDPTHTKQMPEATSNRKEI